MTTTQTELFEIRQAGNLTIFEPVIRLASGNQQAAVNNHAISVASFSPQSPPVPASVSAEREPLPPFARNSKTSRHAAIKKYDAENSGNQRELILQWIRFCGDKGATREEIESSCELDGNTVRPRIKELLGEAKGWTVPLLRRSGETRKTKSGLDAEVLVAI